MFFKYQSTKSDYNFDLFLFLLIKVFQKIIYYEIHYILIKYGRR